jgi:chemotaxis methyl-accepting protein methylase
VPPPPGAEPWKLAPDELDRVLAIVREREGVDFSGYRRSTLARRVSNAMIAAGAAAVGAYLERLRDDPAESTRLLDRLTVKVSRFYRDRTAVEALSRALGAPGARGGRPPAAWSAGCGRGEEPYTLAILLAELGDPAAGPRAVLATDLDGAALAAARIGRYPGEALAEAPAHVRERWMEPLAVPGAFAVSPELRRRVAFARHDLARDGVPSGAPFDLVSCRNTLIYFDPPLQRRVLGVLCDALRPGGLLWLGEAEWPSGPVAKQLTPLVPQARLFRLDEGAAHA